MKKITHILLALCLSSLASCSDMKKVSVTVVEENGEPIAGANVHVAFIGYTDKDGANIKGESNKVGEFVARGYAPLRMKVMIDKKNYYPSIIKKLSKLKDHDLKIVMRKVKNPIPLYARRATLHFPVNREWIGYDFKVGDWVKPHGVGVVKDAFFRCDTVKTGERDGKGSVSIKFKNDEGLYLEIKNYLVTSTLKMPHLAPLNGYQSLFKREEDSFRNKNFRENVGCFFRTRVMKENGEIISANYGKLLTDVRFSPRHSNYSNKPIKYGTVLFTYYFNPTPNDRNLEFDPQKKSV